LTGEKLRLEFQHSRPPAVLFNPNKPYVCKLFSDKMKKTNSVQLDGVGSRCSFGILCTYVCVCVRYVI